MKRICLSVIGLFLFMFSAFAQPAVRDTSQYKPRKLTFEEANFVTSYYKQDGNNAAVTGGIGSEKLSDISTAIDVKFIRWDRKDRKHSYVGEIGMDHYTSASSDKINPYTISSASHADTRLYPSFSWDMENLQKGSTVGAGLSLSSEYDYTSIGAHVNFSQKTKNRNGEFTAKGQIYLDKLKYILPVELRTNPNNNSYNGEGEYYPSKSRNSYSGSFSYSQIVNARLQLMFIADLVYQQGYLGLPFHRVYFQGNSITPKVENLPATRMKIPLGFRANYFIGDKVILRSFYRYYTDDWGLSSHTVQLESSIKVTPFLSVTPFYRYYTQTAIDYFAPYLSHKTTDKYYSSNYDFSAFNSNFYGAGFKITPTKGVFGIQRLTMLELRYGHYTRTTGLSSDIISMNLKFK